MWMRSSLFLLIPRCQFNYNALEIAFLLTGLTLFLLNERGTREKKRERVGGRRKLFWGRVANSKMFISKVNDILKWHKLIISANERGWERESERDKATVTASGVKTAQIEAEMEGEKERERGVEGVVERALSVLKQSAFYFNLLI